MKTALLAWGSLVWDPRALPLESSWVPGGPQLPIEFSRVSGDARLTLVIDPAHGATVSVRFGSSARRSLPDAVADLRDREGTVMRRIGYTDASGASASFRQYPDHQFAHERILPWLASTDYEAVVWTALPSNYQTEHNHVFSVDHAVAYLRGLPTAPRARALEYIRKAPAEVMTPLRTRVTELRLIEQESPSAQT